MRSHWRAWLLLAALIAALPLSRAVSAETAAPQPTRPNILLLVSDDQAYSTFNRTLMPTVFSQLVDQGTLFDRQYVRSSMCCPSRAEMYTGLDERHTGVDSNTGTLARPTIAQALHEQGYRTALTGKYLNSWPCGNQRPEFDLWVCQGNDGSSYSSVDPRLNVNGHWQNFRGVAPQILADDVSNFIKSTPADQPFFATYTPTTPHIPADDPRYASMPVAPYRPASYDEDTTADGKPAYLHLPKIPADRAQLMDNEYADMSRSVRGLDDSIGTILDSLGDRANNTIVFYISDNGYLYGEHRTAKKIVPYEESVNTPFVVRYPALGTKATVSHALVQNVDITPTIADLAGIRWRADGTSLLPLLNGSRSQVRDAALIEYCEGPSYPCGVPYLTYNYAGIYDPPSFQGVVEKGMKYVEYATGEKELYNLDTDRAEMHNLAGAADETSEQTRLASELADLAAPPAAVSTIVTGPSGPQTARSFTFTYFSRAADPVFQCRLTTNGVAGDWYPCGSESTTVGPLDDGDYVFQVSAVDDGGQPSGDADSRAFSMHTSGPPVTITQEPAPRTSSATSTFKFTSTQADVTYQCQLSLAATPASSWQACQQGPDGAGRMTFTGLSDHDWYFRVRAVDTHGVATTPAAERLFHVDKIGPQIAFDEAPAPTVTSTHVSVLFHFVPGTAIVGGVSCRIDSQPSASCSWGTFSATAPTPGRHTISVTATDILGVRHTTTTSYVRDITAPTVRILSPSGVVSEPPLIAFRSSELATSTCQVDNGAIFECQPPSWLFGVANGRHTLRVWATDAAGNKSAAATTEWTQRGAVAAAAASSASAAAPAVRIDSDWPTQTQSGVIGFGFTANQPDATFVCSLDGSGFAPCLSPTGYDDLAPGRHTFAVEAVNASGAVSRPATATWTVVSAPRND